MNGPRLKRAIKHAVGEGGIVAVAAGMAWLIGVCLSAAGFSIELTHQVKIIHRWLILFMSAYIPARFWASMLVDDLETGVKRFRRFLNGVGQFLHETLKTFSSLAREEYQEWKVVLNRTKETAEEEDDSTSTGVTDDD
jgi:hypothetical protein